VKARDLGELLSSLDYIEEVFPVQTNILIFKLNSKIKDTDFVEKLGKNNIKALVFGPQTIRFVTHLNFTDDMLKKVKDVLTSINV
jgi:threonine aldolase